MNSSRIISTLESKENPKALTLCWGMILGANDRLSRGPYGGALESLKVKDGTLIMNFRDSEYGSEKSRSYPDCSTYNLIVSILSAYSNSPLKIAPARQLNNNYQIVIDKETFQALEAARVQLTKEKEEINLKLRQEEHKKLASTHEKIKEKLKLELSSVKDPTFVRYIKNVDEELKLSETDFMRCCLYVPGVKQELMHTSRACRPKIDTSDIGLLVDPFHEKTQLKYWAKKATGLYVDFNASNYIAAGITSFRRMLDKTFRYFGIREENVHITSAHQTNSEFVEHFIDKCVELEGRRTSEEKTYKNAHGEERHNPDRGKDTIQIHNEAGICYSVKGIRGILLQDTNNIYAFSKALKEKQKLEAHGAENIFIAYMKDGLLTKISENDLKPSLKVLQQLNNMEQAKKYDLTWTVEESEGASSIYSFFIISFRYSDEEINKMRTEISSEFEQLFGLKLEYFKKSPAEGYYIDCSVLDKKLAEMADKSHEKKVSLGQ